MISWIRSLGIRAMRTETIKKTYYTFEELNDEHKKRAIENNRYINVEHDWWEYVYDDTIQIGKILGLKIERIFFSGFWSQGDGACFECYFSHEKQILKRIKEYAPKDEELHRIAKAFSSLHAKSFYTTKGRTKQSGYYNHEYSMIIDIDHEKGAENYEEWKELLADFARWIYKSLKNEYKYLTSDETIAESLIDNGCEFEIENL